MTRLAVFLVPVLALCFGLPAAAQEDGCGPRDSAILADLSTHTITIDAKFTGAPVLVFGAIECPGEVVAVVRGPRRAMTVRERVRIAGVWMSGAGVTFPDAPSLYAVGTTAPLEEILPENVRRARSIGLADMQLAVERTDYPNLQRFRDSLIRHQQARGLYSADPQPVNLIGNRLFRASFWLPSTVPTGQYIADVYLVRDGAIIGTHSLALSISKAGFEARVFDFAHRQPALYGAFAISVCALAGWWIGVMFRRS